MGIGSKAGAAIGKVASSSAAKGAVGLAGKGAGAIGGGANAAGAAVAGAGLQAGASAVHSMKSHGFVMFLLAGGLFIFGKFANVPDLHAFFSLIFMVWAAITIFENKATWVVVSFVIWYIGFGAVDFIGVQTWNGFMVPNIGKIVAFVLPILFIGTIIQAAVGKKEGGSFFDRIKDGGVIGLILILLFAWDSGMFYHFFPSFQSNAYFSLLANNIPVWAYVGLFASSRDGEKNAWITLGWFVGIGYLLAMLLLFPSLAAGSTDSGSFLPGLEEVTNAKKQANEALSECEKNQGWYGIQCLGGMFSGESNTDKCVNDKMLNCKAEASCSEKYPGEGMVTTKNKCKADYIKQAKSPAGSIQGTVDKDDLPTKISLQFDADQKSAIARGGLYPGVLPTAHLIVNNPRQIDLNVEVDCHYVKRVGKRELVNSSIEGENTINTGNEVDFKSPFSCERDGIDNGTYDVVFTATVKGIKTTTELSLAFVGGINGSDFKEVKREVNEIILKKNSGGPADPARIDFSLGHSPGDVIITKSQRKIQLLSAIKNEGQGKIIRYDYEFELPNNLNPKDGSSKCLIGSQEAASKDEKRPIPVIPLPNCRFEYPNSLIPEHSKSWHHKTVKSTLTYDYQMEATMNHVEFKSE